MQFSPLSEAYGLKKKVPKKAPIKEQMTQVATVSEVASPAPAPAPVPVPSAPAQAAPVAQAAQADPVVPVAPVAPVRRRSVPRRERRRRESFFCRFSQEEKMDLILIMQFLNFAIVMYLLWTRRA